MSYGVWGSFSNSFRCCKRNIWAARNLAMVRKSRKRTTWKRTRPITNWRSSPASPVYMLKSKLFRQYLSLMPIYLAFEYAACYLAASLMGYKDNTWMEAGFLILALYGFRIANWLFKAAMAVPVYYITKKRRINMPSFTNIKFQLPKTCSFVMISLPFF